MQIVSRRHLLTQEDSIYFQKFVDKNGIEYGLRFGNPKDAKSISNIFKEIYNYEYLDPLVYNIEELKKEISKNNKFWVIGELLENKEVAGTGLVEKNRYIAHAAKVVVKKKFQGLGVTTKIGAAGLISILKMPQFKDVLRLDTDVRGVGIGTQKLAQKAGAIPFGLIPAYNNYGDKRNFEVDDNNPFPPIREEPAFLYSIIFKNLWSKREKKIFLLNNEDFIFFYDYVKKMNKKMDNDILILDKDKINSDHELYGVAKDYFKGKVNLYGYIKEKSLKNLLKTYCNWRFILWKIPTTKSGISSMNLAIDKGFKIVGYDIGFNNDNWTLFDSVILAYYPKNNCNNVEVNCTDTLKPLVKKIKELFSP